MGEIKSALELALERTADVKGDRTSLEAHEARQTGMRLAGEFMANPEGDAPARLAKTDKKKQHSVKQGFLQVLLSHLALPSAEADLQKLPTIEQGLALVIKDKRSVGSVMEQVQQLLQQYLDNKQQLIEALRNQFESRLRQREQEMARKMGTQVKLDPASDPEFSKALSQNMSRLQQQYGQVIAQAKEQFNQLFEHSK